MLEEVILDVLHEGMKTDEDLGPKYVTEKTGLPSGEFDGQHKNWLAFGFLRNLMEQGRIHRPRHGHYELTEKELARRRSDT